MPANFDVVTVVPSSALVNGSTIVASYPTGRTRADYLLGTGHKIVWNGLVLKYPNDCTISLGSTSATFTLAKSITIPAGSTVYCQLDRAGDDNSSFTEALDVMAAQLVKAKASAALAPVVMLSIGSPVAASTTAVCASQTPGTPGTTFATGLPLTINGGKATSGKAYPDIPRNVTVVSASNLTGYTVRATGIDCYGNAMAEEMAAPNATTTAGKKAFARVDSVVIYGSGTMAALTIGFGVVFGLPINLQSTQLILKEIQDGAAPGTAGTFVAADNSTPTATTGDVRGTYTPNATPDGSKAFHLFVLAINFDAGAAQFVT